MVLKCLDLSTFLLDELLVFGVVFTENLRVGFRARYLSRFVFDLENRRISMNAQNAKRSINAAADFLLGSPKRSSSQFASRAFLSDRLLAELPN